MINAFINAQIYTPEGMINKGSLIVQNGVITKIVSQNEDLLLRQVNPDEIIDVNGNYLVPGFIDVHVHGGNGYDVMNGSVEEIEGLSKFHACNGTTAILPTTFTSDQTLTELAITSIVKSQEKGVFGSEIVGIHLEGPFINENRSGAQNSNYIRNPSIDEFKRYMDLSRGNIKLITLAPEQPGALELIQFATDKGVTVSVGHSDATYDEVAIAIRNGARHVTHLFNGMSPLHHREPGVVGAALMEDKLTVELICDGFHIHPKLINYVFQTKPNDKIVLITDAMLAAGLPDGNDYNLGELRCYLKDGQVRLKGEDVLAGSCLTMGQALINVMKFTNLSLAGVLPTLTLNPAKQIGLAHKKGSIEKGKDADLVILNDNFKVVSTFVKGFKVY